MDIKELEILAAAVSEGSLAAAARKLDITPMAASRALASLEQKLGVRLMHRTTRSISLTPEGEEFLTYARSIIELADTALGAISHSGSGVAGTLKVTCPHVFGRVVLMPILKALLRSNPALNVELLMTDSVMDIVEEGVDLAIRLAHPKDSGLVAKQLSAIP